MTTYPSVSAAPDFPAIEREMLALWEKEGDFKASIKNREGADEFIFYDGPPFANGLPHYGHLLTSCVKDIFARYQTMQGNKVERRFGWDCHGLPAEMEAEKELKVSGRVNIEAFGIEKFNAHCRASVMKYTTEWQDYIRRAARWVDFENDYKTMDRSYMESVLWAFKQLYDKGLIYESFRVMPYSWAMETPVSNFETRLDNSYREREDRAVTVAFTLSAKPNGAPEARSYQLLAWTTTPWTLPSNLALAVNPEMEYAFILISSPPAGEHDASRRVGGGKTDFAIDKAQAMRKEPTEAEKKLWHALSQKQLGYKFRRQQPIGSYIVDFYNSEKRLAIEIDGGQHADKAADQKRTEWLESQGLKVIRFWNNEVLENIDGVLQTIKDALDSTPHAVSNETAAPPLGGSENTVCYIVSAKAAKDFTQEDSDIITIKGADLVNLTYTPLFPYFKNHPNAFRVLAGDFIEEGSGTGVVHIAPGFGEDDQRVAESNGITLVCPVDEKGRFTAEVPDYQGLQVFEANVPIIKYLKEIGAHIKTESYKHNYPHCWRTDTPLIYKAVPSWYVEVTKFKDRMVELNQGINWIPEHIRDGQFGKWLENARDWSISRNRYWGTPIPVWRTESGKIKVFGSIKELEEFFGTKVTDLHRPFIDQLTKLENGETWRRVTDVFDCWFESGSMPFAQVHYPFENKDWFEGHFPADFIVEYVAQTRGWFYTLMVLSTALFDRIPFKNCICHGVILDTQGHKLSKRLNNYADPREMFETYGADSLRWLMVSAPIMQGGELLITKDGSDVRDVVRLAVKPIWNAFHFFTLYANADGIKASLISPQSPVPSPLDQYILAKCRAAVETIEQALNAYDTPSACRAVMQFFEALNNWYIRRSRTRFWREEKDADKQAAYDTLYTVLSLMAKAAAPLLPLTLEAVWRGLNPGERSLHLQDFPDVSAFNEQKELVADMDRVRDACTAIHSIRNKENIRTRQPLNKATLYGAGSTRLKAFADLIAEETNVKEIEFSDQLETAANFKLQIHFPILGKRVPQKMKEIIPLSKQGKWEKQDGNVVIAGLALEPGEYDLLLEPKVKKGAEALSSNDALVVLDCEVTEELRLEGIARDIVRMIQQARKDADLNISDRIALSVKAEGDVAKSVEVHQAYIEEQTLSQLTESKDLQHTSEQELEGQKIMLGFSKAA